MSCAPMTARSFFVNSRPSVVRLGPTTEYSRRAKINDPAIIEVDRRRRTRNLPIRAPTDLHRRDDSIRVNDDEAGSEDAIRTMLGGYQDGCTRSEFRPTGPRKCYDGSALGDRYPSFEAMIGEGQNTPIGVLDGVRDCRAGHGALGPQEPSI